MHHKHKQAQVRVCQTHKLPIPSCWHLDVPGDCDERTQTQTSLHAKAHGPSQACFKLPSAYYQLRKQTEQLS